MLAASEKATLQRSADRQISRISAHFAILNKLKTARRVTNDATF